jgi:hypothetical protein
MINQQWLVHQFGTKFWANLVRNFSKRTQNTYINKGILR